MSSYLVNKFKGVYRILPNLTYDNTDFARNMDGSIDEDNVYIKCGFNCKIVHYGNTTLMAYIPSIGRGHNIKKAMQKDKIEIVSYDESDEEVIIGFKVKDIEYMAQLMKAGTSGAGISPFSSKNIPKNKEVGIPDEEIEKYKAVASKVGKGDMLKIKSWNNDFLENVLQKKIRKETKNKKYSYKEDMKNSNMSRQVKEFIWSKNMFEDYVNYLDSKIEAYYNNN